jgi:hypothetical protein
MKIRLLSGLLLSASMAMGQVFTDLGTSAAAQAGSGDATVAAESSVWSYAVNPAGFSNTEGLQVGVTHFRPYQESFVQVSRFSLVYSSKSWGSFNIHGDLNQLSYLGNDLSSEVSAGLSHAFFLQKDLRSSLAFGYSINFLSVGYGEKSAGYSGDGSDGVALSSGQAVGIDLGLQASMRNRSWMGIFIQNVNQPVIGSGIVDYHAARKVVLGAGYMPYYGLMSSIAVEKAFGGDFQYNAGLDYEVLQWLSIRAGLNTYPSQLSLGAGLNWKGFALDYALVNHPVLPATHLISFEFNMAK